MFMVFLKMGKSLQARGEAINSSFASPELLNLKRSKSGRLDVLPFYQFAFFCCIITVLILVIIFPCRARDCSEAVQLVPTDPIQG